MLIDENLKQYALSDRQREILEAVETYGRIEFTGDGLEMYVESEKLDG